MNRPPYQKVILVSLSIAAIGCMAWYLNLSPQSENLIGEEFDDPAGRAAYEFNMTKDPATGKIPDRIFEQELAQAREIYARQLASKVQVVNSYAFQGPENLGGRTRSVVYDVRFLSNQTILAGGVSGGVFKSTDNGATWTRKSPTNKLYSVTSIAQDTRAGQENTWYYATGEDLNGNSASETGSLYLGDGVYKSTDNGETWAKLDNSNNGQLEVFDRVQDVITKIIVSPVDGSVYMAALDAIFRSTDGGNSWNPVLSSGGSVNSGMVTDIVVTNTGRFYAAFSGAYSTMSPPPTNVAGVWTSTSGAAGTWTKIAGATAATNPAGWDANGSYGRVVLALAPSNQNILYALYDDFDISPNVEAELFKWDQLAGVWVDRSANLPVETTSMGPPVTEPLEVQGGYDLVVAVKPDNENVVFVGGTNLYRSTDGFATNTNWKRIGGYAAVGTSALYANSHPDFHSIVFPPGSPNIMVCGNDGGLQRTNDNLATTVAWTHIANGYRTYQYYYVTLDPRNANTKVLGGAQDNGTTRNIGGSGTSFEQVLPGDGVSVGLSKSTGGIFYEYGGSQYGEIYRRNSLGAPNTGSVIRPNAASDDGLFVTLFRLDPDNTDTIYYASDSSLYRNTSASTATANNWTKLTGVQSGIVDGATPKTQITALATSRGAYNVGTSSLFIGTNEGRLYRLDNPAASGAATVPVNITGGAFPNAYISSIAVNPRNDDTVLITFSNYGVESVFWTGNANSNTPTWLNVEASLTLPSYRSSVIAITSNGVEYFVGTSVGLYAATINSANPNATAWAQEGASDIGNALVNSLALRPSDNRLLVGTHGIGMWATTLSSASLPVNFTSFTGRVEDRQNLLFWKVENEIDNQGYEIQRKYRNEANFSKIGFIAAKSANAAANEYTFPDALVDLGTDNASYRLKQIDIDGNFQYSTTVTLTRKISNKFVEYIAVRPSSLLIRMNGQSNRPLNFRLFDNSGKLVQQKQLQQRTQEIPMVGLPRGVFIVELSTNDGRRHSQRIVY